MKNFHEHVTENPDGTLTTAGGGWFWIKWSAGGTVIETAPGAKEKASYAGFYRQSRARVRRFLGLEPTVLRMATRFDWTLSRAEPGAPAVLTSSIGTVLEVEEHWIACDLSGSDLGHRYGSHYAAAAALVEEVAG